MRPGGGSHTGAGLFVFCLVAATDKDQSNTSLLSLLLLLLLLEARPLNRDKVGVCECMCQPEHRSEATLSDSPASTKQAIC